MMHLIGFIIFGLVVGLVARLLMPGRDSMSLPVTAILGIVGSLFAGWFGRAVGWYGEGDGAGFIVSTLGALALLFAYNAFVRRRSARALADRSKKDFPRKVA